MTVKGVLRVGEVAIRVMDIGAARVHYGETVGLIETHRDGDGTTYYKAWDEWDAYSIVIREADRPGMDHFAFKVLDDGALTEIDERLRERGIEVTPIEKGVHRQSGRRIQFTLPTGHLMHLYAEKEQVGNTLGIRNPGVVPADGVVKGMRVNRLDHVLLGGPPPLNQLTVELLMDVLGFSMSEKLVDAETGTGLALFLSCSNKPHDLAFVPNPEPARFHHVSFLLESLQDVYHAADRLGRDNVPIEVGPNRHGVTRGATIYFFDPSGNRNEVFSGGYVYYPDTPTLVWDTTEMGYAVFSQDRRVPETFLGVST